MCLSFFFLSGFLHARGTAESSIKQLTIYGLKGSSGVGMVRLFEEPPRIPGFNIKVEALAQIDLMAARFISGEARVGILPPNIAAKIASSGKDLRAAAIIGNGMLSLLGSDSGVRNLADLRGKTVEVAAQGATPDFVFRKLLESNGLTPERDVILGYSMAPPEIAQSLIAGKVSFALLPEPFAAMALAGKPDLVSVTDIQQEWSRVGGKENFPMTLLVIDGAFADENPGAVKEILNAIKTSVEWVRAYPAEAGSLVEKHELGISAPVVAAAVPKSNYVFIPAAEGRASIEALLNLFLSYAPASIGGFLPGDRFYLN